jgi:hypothetical protein
MPHTFYCEKCDFKCSKQSIYNKHLETLKHARIGNIQIHSGYIDDTKNILSEKCPKTGYSFICQYCLKSYKYHSGLWRHKQECGEIVTTTTTTDNIEDYVPTLDETMPINEIIRKNVNNNLEKNNDKKIKNLADENREMRVIMMTMIRSNSQLQLQMLEMMKATHMTTINASTRGVMPNINGDSNATTVNSHNNNNTFNMNLFLNEKCKDAMNMKDFVNSIQLNMTDMENVGRLGYVEGMSNIFIDNLQKTDIYKRPVHCSDVKRETLYVKDNNEWQRDGPEHEKMTGAILAMEQKNVVLVNEWAKANPRCMNSNTRENEKYFKLAKVVTDGEKDGNIDKVIRKVAKRVAIEKDTPQIE